MHPDLSIIIPTYNEAENIQNTIQHISHIVRNSNVPFEIIIVDDSSTDNTQQIVIDLIARRYPVVLITRAKDPGLSQSVMAGIEKARGSVVVVTDADLSHSVELIPTMYNDIKTNNTDIVIGSRYMSGGGIEDWPLKRRIISWGATFLSKILFPQTTDPISGFFGIKKDLVLNTPNLRPKGYKILLEFLGKCKWNKITELPYTFKNRKLGNSKLKTTTIVDFIKQLIDISLYPGRSRDEMHKILCFGLVGLTGIGVNMFGLVIFKNYLPLLVASFVAIELSIITNFVLNDQWTFKENNYNTFLHRMISYNGVAAVGMLINMVTLGLLTLFGVWYVAANFIGILLGFAWNFLGNRKLTWKAI